MTQSEPTLTKFNPRAIPYQYRVIEDVRKNFDYNLGVHEILLSGAVGSSKSTVAAHLAVTHCLLNPGARFLIGRKSLPDLKSTAFQKIVEHIEHDLVEDRDYWVNATQASIKFRNGSEIISRSWSDKRYKKMRSLELSSAFIEELTENTEEDQEIYHELKMRIGRLPGIHERFLISATNPDSPQHWGYKYFILENKPTIHVYYSVTTDNPFLPKSYVDQLKQDLDPKLARRMIYGEWLEIRQDVIYYSYSRESNYLDKHYQIDPRYPVHLSWDFNIGDGKPLSACAFQYINDNFHVFDQVVIDGARTLDSCEEWHNKGILERGKKFIIHGDATGAARHTASLHSDYDIIRKFFDNYPGINSEMQVPKANPPIRTRHNMVNSYCQNAVGQTRLTVYKGAPTVDEALRLTAFKKNSDIEDDSKRYQHIGTALGYGLVYCVNSGKRVRISTGVR